MSVILTVKTRSLVLVFINVRKSGISAYRVSICSVMGNVPEKVTFMSNTKHATGVIVFGAVASNILKMYPVFIEADLKVSTDVYLGILKKKVLPWVKENFDELQQVFFQQDGALCRTSNWT